MSRLSTSLLALLVAGCGSSSTEGTADPGSQVDECLGAFTQTTNCLNKAVFTVDAVQGDAPDGLAPGTTTCTTSPSKTTAIYSDWAGKHPFDCDSAWKLTMRINEGENARDLEINGNTGAVMIPAGSVAMSFAAELDGCQNGKYSFSPTGSGTVALDVKQAEAPSCATVTFDAVEFDSATEGTFQLSATLRAKFMPVGEQ